MQPNYLPLVKIFGAERHVVPLFQRPYVWQKEENWEPLWQDFSDLCDRVLAAPNEPVRGHFLGTLVLEQIPHKSGGVSTREIVDGQQRLTTLQILGQAVRHALQEVEVAAANAGDEPGTKAARLAAARIGAMTRNPDFSEEDEQYKVWPTNEDRQPFRQVMDAARPADLMGVETRMAHAYRFFLDGVRPWLAAGPAEERSNAISTALREQVRMIVLDLDDTDEPQAIFETLNAHGTPLLPADLIKNWLLWDAARQKLPLDQLYKQHWIPFDHDHDFWRAEVGTGHARRARIDTFLQNWLTMRCREMIPAKHLYDRFVKRMETERTDDEKGDDECGLDAVMSEIAVNGARFRTLVEPLGKTRFDTFLRRLSVMGLVVFHPFLLAVMARKELEQPARETLARVLESYLVRRMICNADTRGYGALCLTLLGALAGAGGANVVGAVLASLADADSKVIHWPTDEEFGRDWLRRQFYNSLRRDRVVMLLQAIEEHYQSENVKGEPIIHFDYSKLQVEHIMPQKWHEHWSVDGEAAIRLRDSKVDTIGNLTLVSEKLNPSLSNASWLGVEPMPEGKKAGLAQHSLLRLNSHLVSKYPDVWDEACIDSRADALLAAAKMIWPAPTAF